MWCFAPILLSAAKTISCIEKDMIVISLLFIKVTNYKIKEPTKRLMFCKPSNLYVLLFYLWIMESCFYSTVA